MPTCRDMAGYKSNEYPRMKKNDTYCFVMSYMWSYWNMYINKKISSLIKLLKILQLLKVDNDNSKQLEFIGSSAY